MDLAEIKKLIKLFESTALSELEVEKEGQRVLMRKGGGQFVAAPAPAMHMRPAEGPLHYETGSAPAPEERPRVEEVKLSGHVIASPMVGTFFRSPSPTSPPYVEVGDHVRKGQVLCLVEAMKLMNEIECDVDGKVTRILPENGKPVEYGQPLFEIIPS